MNKRRRGRPDGPTTTTKDDILAAARPLFLERGYAGVTMRAVAGSAGVDPALISYHFGSKGGLFGAAMGLTASPPRLLAQVLDGPEADLPQRLLTTVLATWDDPGTGGALRTLSEAAITDPEVARLFREMIHTEMVGRIAEHVGGRYAEQRATAATAQLAGLIFARYILRAEPFASADPDELIRTMTPPLRMALGGTISAAPTR